MSIKSAYADFFEEHQGLSFQHYIDGSKVHIDEELVGKKDTGFDQMGRKLSPGDLVAYSKYNDGTVLRTAILLGFTNDGYRLASFAMYNSNGPRSFEKRNVLSDMATSSYVLLIKAMK